MNDKSQRFALCYCHNEYYCHTDDGWKCEYGYRTIEETNRRLSTFKPNTYNVTKLYPYKSTNLLRLRITWNFSTFTSFSDYNIPNVKLYMRPMYNTFEKNE